MLQHLILDPMPHVDIIIQKKKTSTDFTPVHTSKDIIIQKKKQVQILLLFMHAKNRYIDINFIQCTCIIM